MCVSSAALATATEAALGAIAILVVILAALSVFIFPAVIIGGDACGCWSDCCCC